MLVSTGPSLRAFWLITGCCVQLIAYRCYFSDVLPFIYILGSITQLGRTMLRAYFSSRRSCLPYHRR
nr:MAG TPA: hypothetical protein [Bacteriophage sp.]